MGKEKVSGSLLFQKRKLLSKYKKSMHPLTPYYSCVRGGGDWPPRNNHTLDDVKAVSLYTPLKHAHLQRILDSGITAIYDLSKLVNHTDIKLDYSSLEKPSLNLTIQNLIKQEAVLSNTSFSFFDSKAYQFEAQSLPGMVRNLEASDPLKPIIPQKSRQEYNNACGSCHSTYSEFFIDEIDLEDVIAKDKSACCCTIN